MAQVDQSSPPISPFPPSAPDLPWYRQLNGYHWFVFTVCTLGWLFDCLDQQLFNLARRPAITDLMGLTPGDPRADYWGGIATSILMIGWATGGIIFGMMGDRIGRVKTMVFTITAYSLSTGLSGFAFTLWDFLAYRFIAGLGVGGQFAVGVALVAESLPDRARPQALGMLQALSAVGNVGAAVITLALYQLADTGAIGHAWKWMFAIGVIPALLVIPVIKGLREPDAWKRAKAERDAGKHRESLFGELFGDPRWRRRAIVGLLIASAGVIGLWSIGVFSNDLTQSIFRKKWENEARENGEAIKDAQFAAGLVADPQKLTAVKDQVRPQFLLGVSPAQNDARAIYATALGLQEAQKPVNTASVLQSLDQPSDDRPAQSAADRARRAELLAQANPVDVDKESARISGRYWGINNRVGRWAAITLGMFNVGAFFGIYLFSKVTSYIGRRPTFALAFTAALASTVIAFLFMETTTDLFWMVPLMGFCQLSVFGGYAIYFPELFPTRLRATGTSFCYNIGRYVAATGPLGTGWLSKNFFSHTAEPLRYAGVAMSACFLVGIVALFFAPETKDQPLPE